MRVGLRPFAVGGLPMLGPVPGHPGGGWPAHAYVCVCVCLYVLGLVLGHPGGEWVACARLCVRVSGRESVVAPCVVACLHARVLTRSALLLGSILNGMACTFHPGRCCSQLTPWRPQLQPRRTIRNALPHSHMRMHTCTPTHSQTCRVVCGSRARGVRPGPGPCNCSHPCKPGGSFQKEL